MVEIVTLFLGLAMGPTTVELAVVGEVAAVVLELDGRTAARLTAPPWRAEVDLGAALEPRRLSAVALGSDGLELHRASRLLNLYRPPAEVDYVLHRNSKGWLTMLELVWRSRAGAAPGRFAVSVDGRTIDADDASQVWVPPLDPAELHLIEVVVEYSDGSLARDWIGFGGPGLSGGSSRLTPLQAEVPTTGGAPDAVTARSIAGEVLPVAGVERGDTEIIVVRDGRTAESAGSLMPARRGTGALSGARDAQAARAIHVVPLRAEEWVRILDSSAVRSAETRLDPRSVQMRLAGDQPGDFGLFWHLRERDQELEPGPAWTADALALGASRVATGSRRAALVLVQSAGSTDELSEFEPEAVRGYLATLGVLVEVWYLGRSSKAPTAWGAPTEVRSVAGLEAALDDLRAALDRRRVVWVAGVHLPGEIVLESAPN